MDEERFDSWAKALAGVASRRRVTGGLVGSLLGLFGHSSVLAANCGRVGNSCSSSTPCCKHFRCSKGVCQPPLKGSDRCHSDAECTPTGNPCVVGTCDRNTGACSQTLANGVACSVNGINGICSKSTCDLCTSDRGVICPASGTPAGYVCSDTRNDSNNCGSCAAACDVSHQNCCGGQCVDVPVDTSGNHLANCECYPSFPDGPCFNCNAPTMDFCSTGFQTGVCIDTINDPNNCGSCSFVCSSGVCMNGACQ